MRLDVTTLTVLWAAVDAWGFLRDVAVPAARPYAVSAAGPGTEAGRCASRGATRPSALPAPDRAADGTVAVDALDAAVALTCCVRAYTVVNSASWRFFV